MVLLENPAGGDPVPVVAGQILVELPDDGALRQELLRRLRSFGFDDFVVESSICGSLVTFTSSEPGSADIAAALDAIDGEFPSGPNHFFPLAWSVKSAEGPEGTCHEFEKLDEVERSGLVVVVDTGLASRAARDRKDGRLNYDAAAEDVDPLDQLSADGAPTPDGCLDLGAGHGTSVAGTVELTDRCLTIEVTRAIGPDAVGDEIRLAAQIRRAAELIDESGGRGVINLSLGTQTFDDKPPVAIECVIKDIETHNAKEDHRQICLVAAAGNSGTDQRVWPAAFNEVIAVAGLDVRGKPAKWSSFGPWVDFSVEAEGVDAPFVVGKETPGTGAPDDPFDAYPDYFDGPDPNAMWTGTSFAAPKVAAWIARRLVTYGDATCAGAREALAAEGKASDQYGVILNPFPDQPWG